MRIFMIICVVVFVVAILIFAAIRKQKINDRKMKSLEDDNPAPKEKLHLLALANILLLDEPKRTLKILGSENAKKKLADDWDISGRESAIRIIQWLLDEGHRQICENNYAELREALGEGRNHELESNFNNINQKLKERMDATDDELQNCQNLIAFDIERLSAIARFSYNLGYISEEECYAYLEQAYNKASAVYKSWRDYAIAFYIGFTICVNSPNPAFMISYAADCLKDQNSLWNRYPLNE